MITGSKRVGGACPQEELNENIQDDTGFKKSIINSMPFHIGKVLVLQYKLWDLGEILPNEVNFS